MQRVSDLNNWIKKIHRSYGQELIKLLESSGYIDLRPSFLEILTFLSENEGESIKKIGQHIGLKKQTMTSHLNELQKRGYIERVDSKKDKREQLIFLTDYGKKFRFSLKESIDIVQNRYETILGEVELERLQVGLKRFYTQLYDQTTIKNNL